MEANEKVKCTKCKNVHSFEDRIWKQAKSGVFKNIGKDLVCPRCGGKTYVKSEIEKL